MAESRLRNLGKTLYYVSWDDHTLCGKSVDFHQSPCLFVKCSRQYLFFILLDFIPFYTLKLSWTISSYISVMSVSSSFSTHTQMLAFLHTTGSQHVVPRPATPAWPRNLLEMQIFRSHLRPPKSKLGGENHHATHSPWPISSMSSPVTVFSYLTLLKLSTSDLFSEFQTYTSTTDRASPPALR